MTYSVRLSILIAALAFCTATIAAPVAADTPETEPAGGMVYTVQPGDTFALIALRYNLNMAALALANNLANPDLIFPGQQLTLPGITDTPPALAAQLPETQPELYIVRAGDTIFTIANQHNVSVGELLTLNNIQNPDLIQIGQPIQIPQGPPPTPGPLVPPFESVEFSEPTIIQGRTQLLTVGLSQAATLSGSFEGRPLFFSQSGPNRFWTVIPIHALAQPHIYPLNLAATLPNGHIVTRHETFTVIDGPYGQENIQLDESRQALLDAELIVREQEKLVNLWSQVSPRPRWEGPFWYPVATNPPRITSNFGTRRSYNNSTELSFHGGTDFGGGVGTPIYAPAAGRVVLAETLTVRGNSVLIDHGLGLFSGYWHQDKIVVSQGQELQPGDLIGYVGSTGLVTGPHLHWEMRLNGIAVDPLQWVRQSIP